MASFDLLPVLLVLLVLLLLLEIGILLFLFLLVVIRRFDFQRSRGNDSQVRATFVTTDGVALVDVFFIEIECSLAYRTGDHRSFLPNYLL